MNPTRLAEMARVKRCIVAGEYDDRITPEVADAAMRDAQKPWTGRPVVPHPNDNVPLVAGRSQWTILATWLVVIPAVGYVALWIVAWVFKPGQL